MSEFNLLSHLGVAIPAAPARPVTVKPTATNAASVKVLAMREKPPLPPSQRTTTTRTTTTTTVTKLAASTGGSSGGAPSSLRHTSAPNSARSNNTGRSGSATSSTAGAIESTTSSAARARGARIVDAPLPCNDYLNMRAAEAKRRAAEERRAAEARAASQERPFTEGSGKVPMAAEEKVHLREELQAAAERARSERHERHERDAHDDRNQLEFLERAAAEDDARRQHQKQQQAALRDELQHRADEARARRRHAAAANQHVDACETEGLRIGEEHSEAKQAAARSKSADMRRFWEKQIRERQERAVSERQRELLRANVDLIANDAAQEREAHSKRASRADASVALAEVTAQREAAKRQAAAAKQRERVAAEEAAQRGAAAEQRERAERAEKQQALRAEIGRMIEQRKSQTTRSTVMTRKLDRERAELREQALASNGPTLYRCPATGRVLPPSAFNIPRTGWNAPSMSSFM